MNPESHAAEVGDAGDGAGGVRNAAGRSCLLQMEPVVGVGLAEVMPVLAGVLSLPLASVRPSWGVDAHWSGGASRVRRRECG